VRFHTRCAFDDLDSCRTFQRPAPNSTRRTGTRQRSTRSSPGRIGRPHDHSAMCRKQCAVAPAPGGQRFSTRGSRVIHVSAAVERRALWTGELRRPLPNKSVERDGTRLAGSADYRVLIPDRIRFTSIPSCSSASLHPMDIGSNDVHPTSPKMPAKYSGKIQRAGNDALDASSLTKASSRSNRTARCQETHRTQSANYQDLISTSAQQQQQSQVF